MLQGVLWSAKPKYFQTDEKGNDLHCSRHEQKSLVCRAGRGTGGGGEGGESTRCYADSDLAHSPFQCPKLSGRKGRRTVRIRRERTRRRRNRRKEEQGRKRTRWGPGECSIELAFWIHILLGRKRHGM